ncbi:MAG: AtpZ/AtpI family protein [Patescibacteria group bacterium]|jgi:F0F1-type ATP synthase assembly protein I
MAEQPKTAWWQPALTIFYEVTGWIVVPIVFSLFVGRALDRKFDTEPWWFLGLTALAFVITTVGIVRVASKYLKQIEEEGKKKRANQTTDERNNQHN